MYGPWRESRATVVYHTGRQQLFLMSTATRYTQSTYLSPGGELLRLFATVQQSHRMQASVAKAATTLKLASVIMDVRIDLAADHCSWPMNSKVASTSAWSTAPPDTSPASASMPVVSFVWS